MKDECTRGKYAAKTQQKKQKRCQIAAGKEEYMMYEDDVEKIDGWFQEDRTFSYHHTEEEDGEDIYFVSAMDFEEFAEFLAQNLTDFMYIPGKIGNDGVWFSTSDLEKARFY